MNDRVRDAVISLIAGVEQILFDLLLPSIAIGLRGVLLHVAILQGSCCFSYHTWLVLDKSIHFGCTRGLSLPSVHTHPGHIGCNDGFLSLNSGSPNPNVLVGIIAGGPDSRDNFEDDRNNYQQSELATYINAPLVGALAVLSTAI